MKLRAALQRYTDVEVLGAIGRDQALEIPERHLGLIPANEDNMADETIERLAAAVAADVDIERVIEIADTGDSPVKPNTTNNDPVNRKPDVRIAIARDAAFGFYYPDDLDAFAVAGAELVPFDTLSDTRLPEVDGLFIGGGFPETHLSALSANRGLLGDIRQSVAAGMPVYAECGGLMYLARGIQWRDQNFAMVGAVPGDIVVEDRPQGRGYVLLEETGDDSWPPISAEVPAAGAAIPAHEFHYARLENLAGGQQFAYRVTRGHGIDGHHDGLLIGNLRTGFVHHRNTAANPWVNRFVNFVRRQKKSS
jgi:cobyrinic acid a,c-diamide synthase